MKLSKVNINGYTSLNGLDTVAGIRARVVIYFDPGSGFRQLEGIFVETLEANIEFQTTDIYTLGNPVAQPKAIGIKGTIDMTFYFVTSIFAQIVEHFFDTGEIVVFRMVIENYDPSSSVGKHKVSLENCILTSTSVAKANVSNESLIGTAKFAFEYIDEVQPFNLPSNQPR